VQQLVEFQSYGERIEALLLLPDQATQPLPAIVMAGGWCYVKELIQPQYAQYFVDAGFAVLIFDYRRMGASGGLPRQHINPYDQQEDYKAAISYIETRPEVDASRIGIWGISYSGGHVLVVGATDARVKCIVSNIPVVDGFYTMKAAHGSLAFRRLMSTIIEDRRKQLETGEFGEMPMSSDPSEGLSTWPFPEVRPVFEKLKAESAPNHEHRNTIASVDLLLTYTVFPYVLRLVNTPTLMIVAEGDDITMWDKEIDAFNAIPTITKSLFVVGDTSHMTLYSNMSRLELAARRAAEWFLEHLG
jgi:fermentation-respiration switch protein FrsA (DUF1100 family)